MPDAACAEPLASGFSPGGRGISMACGSSWEVDLRADVDCDAPGLERCHPRYTLGWRHREVQLWREGLSPPKGSEYVHAYCDVWQRGRLEQVLSAPAERTDVRAERRRRAPSEYPSTIFFCLGSGNHSSPFKGMWAFWSL